MFENSTLGIARADLEGKFVEANRAYCELVGYSNDELRAVTLLDLAVEEDRHSNSQLLGQLGRGDRHDFQIETRYRRKDGQIVWVHNTVSLIPGPDESSSFLMTIAKDISARRKVDDYLRKQNEALQKILDHVPLMISVATKEGSIRFVNREWERTLGWSLEEIIRENLDIFSLCYPDPEHRREVLKFIAEANSEWVEFRLQTRDGQVLDTTWARVKLSDGMSVGIGRDITARKRTEEALKRSEAYLAAGQRLSHTGSWALNVLSKELFWSEETFRIFGVDPPMSSFVLAETFLQRIHPEDRPGIEQGIKEAPKASVGYAKDYRIVLPNGSIRYIHDVIYPVANEVGQIVERYGVVMDVTERTLAELERQRSFDQLRALTARVQNAREEERKRVAREIHDELGQALTAIKIDLSSLVHDFPPEAQETKRIESISKVVDQTIKSVRRISTELRPGILDDMGLIAAVEWAAEEFEARTGTRCRLELLENDNSIDPDRATAIFRILQETLTNVARHANAACVYVRLFKEGGNIVLEVHDDGRGATEEQLSASGSLGIHGMRERALLLGGELAIRGISSQGTTVLVRIPLAESTVLGA
ncbi:MAG TPA: PAS domain S-box protein [Bryobacteraceae bacterium]|nr:PAS domain S-box protein [Bryobacteraceae bacterium]